MPKRGLHEPIALTLRFNEDLRQQLADAASRSVRSMNSEIVFRLRTSFEQDEGEALLHDRSNDIK